MNNLKILLNLVKIKIAFAITFTTFVGFIIFSNSFNFELLFAFLGVLLMSSGALALNQVQEKTFDAKMDRTMNRPLPKTFIKPQIALIISAVLIILGFLVLYTKLNLISALLGIFNVFWYNVVYTYLKRITVFAVIPGALVGVIPILIGWCGAGGYLFEYKIILLSVFMFIWQIPHFWLILFYYNDEYALAGFPTITNSFSKNRIKNIVFVWLIATSSTTLLFPIYQLITNHFLIFLLVAINILTLILFYFALFRKTKNLNKRFSLAGINIYMMLIMIILMINSLI